MRASITTSAARDISRLCTRCRRQAAAAAATTTSLSGTNATASTSLAARKSRWTSEIFNSGQGQRRWMSAAATATSSSEKQTASPSTTSQDSNSSRSSSVKVPSTHYDFFPITLPDGPPPKGHFPIDQRALRREFLRLQAKAHPDMHPAEHKSRAEATSARINEAYKTLSNPLLRAQYLLQLRGVDVANDETLKVEDPELLMLVLEAREEIEEATQESELAGQREANDGRIRESEEVLEEAFRHDDIDTAKREAVKLRYWVNIQESLNNWDAGKPVVLQH